MPSAVSEQNVALSNTPISPSTQPSNNARRASLKVLSRNIDQVVLGNLLFRSWYYSPYPDSIIIGEGQSPNNVASTLGVPTSASAAKQHLHSSTSMNGVAKPLSEQTSTSSKPVPAQPSAATCPLLHVCPYCFRYTPKSVAYAQHLRRHNVTYNPHPPLADQDVEGIKVDSPSTSTSFAEDALTWPVPDSAVKVYEHAGYAVWDVDGEREKLYCQNLSLFGKLFLEQKSVFFDTGGFHYFVLTYTPPPSSAADATSLKRPPTATRTSGRRRTSSAAGQATDAAEVTTYPVPEDITLHTQVLGFFSKENLSWDANNLACILVFPPYQHRNLGQLLMAISYKLSGWEWEGSIIGGPEKPLSSMGRKSYLRFWSERVARFMMGQTADADGRRVFDGVKKKRRKVGYHKEEVTVKEIGDRTGMLAEDVVAALNEMGVLEVVPPKKKKRKSDGDDGAEEQVLSSMIVHRSRVLEWAERRGVDMVSPVKEEGFLGEWALSEVEDTEGEVEESDESQ